MILALGMALCSCTKDKLETIYSKQETQIDAYLTKKAEEAHGIIYRNGSARVIITEGTGEELSSTGFVSFYYAGYVFSSGKQVLFATNHEETAIESQFTVTDPDVSIFEADMEKTELLEGLRNGLTGVKSGEICEILFTGKYGFGNEIFGTVPANSALLYKIWVEGVSND